MNTIVPAAMAAAPGVPHTSTLHARRLAVVAGILEDIEREDNERGYEDAEDTAFWSIVGATRNDACPICGLWSCSRAGCVGGQTARQLAPVGASGQCSVCSGRFDDWNGGVCDACRALGR
ncbi:hypothetical protein ACWERV_23175 [Streptomyces sp. NPDC004031]